MGDAGNRTKAGRRGARTRRAPGEIDDLILGAAQRVFARKGYGSTTFREIAEEAGIHEPMLYRRFNSKARLFEASVLKPFDDVVTAYLDTWAAQSDAVGPLEDLTRSWVPPLYRVIRQERDLIVALLAAEAFHPEDLEASSSFAARMQDIVDRMTPQAEIEIARRPLLGVELPVNIVVSLGMILGVALLDAEGQFALSDAQVVEEMVQATLYGVSGRGGPGTPADAAEISDWLDRVADAERRAIRAELELDLLRRRSGS